MKFLWVNLIIILVPLVWIHICTIYIYYFTHFSFLKAWLKMEREQKKESFCSTPSKALTYHPKVKILPIKSCGKFFIISTEFDNKTTFQIESLIALITKTALIFSWNLLNGQNSCQKVPKSNFQSQFSTLKSSKSIFYTKKNSNFRSTFFVFTNFE